RESTGFNSTSFFSLPPCGGSVGVGGSPGRHRRCGPPPPTTQSEPCSSRPPQEEEGAGAPSAKLKLHFATSNALSLSRSRPLRGGGSGWGLVPGDTAAVDPHPRPLR